MEQQELMNQSYQHIKWAVSGNGNFKINRIIGYKTLRLKDEFGLEDDEIQNAIFDEFLSKKLYEKVTPEKTLSTFKKGILPYTPKGKCLLMGTRITRQTLYSVNPGLTGTVRHYVP